MTVFQVEITVKMEVDNGRLFQLPGHVASWIYSLGFYAHQGEVEGVA